MYIEKVVVHFMIYVTGDMHADFARFSNKKLKKLKKGDYLIVCGDFGFLWNESKKEKNILKKIGAMKFSTLFVDGTHENFSLIKQYREENFHGGKARNITGNLYYLSRGEVYNIDDKIIFAFGGGESCDKEMRISENKWWSEELPTVEEMRSSVSNLEKVERQVDYIVTHEPPGKIKSLFNSSGYNLNILNKFFDDVAKEIKFKKWFFGSTHVNKECANKYVSLFDDIFVLE